MRGEQNFPTLIAKVVASKNVRSQAVQFLHWCEGQSSYSLMLQITGCQ